MWQPNAFHAIASLLLLSKICSVIAYRNAAYFVEWGVYDRGFHPQNLPAADLTHVFYAFAAIGSDGTVFLDDQKAAVENLYEGDSQTGTEKNLFGCFKQFYILKQRHRQLKVLLSIGGWTYRDMFPVASNTREKRTRFAQTAVRLVGDLGLDGLDIDWEYPVNQGEADNLISLLEAVRIALDEYALNHAPGHHFLLSVASPAGPQNYGVLDMRSMNKYLDMWNLMAYDYAVPINKITAHTANLHVSQQRRQETPVSTEGAIHDYKALGVPPAKISLGVPLYGRSFADTAGIGQPCAGAGSGQWEPGVWDYKALPRCGATEHADEVVGASYSYDAATREFVSYDNVAVAQLKVEYIKSAGLGGATFWEGSGDKQGPESQIKVYREGLQTLDQTPNHLTYPNSQYANLAAGMPRE